MATKKPRSITLRGGAANDFTAELMVDQLGEKARENCSGPALEAVNRVLSRRGIGAGSGD